MTALDILLVTSLAIGVVPGGVHPSVSVALVEELSAETEDWFEGAGMTLDVPSAVIAGMRQVSFTPPILRQVES